MPATVDDRVLPLAYGGRYRFGTDTLELAHNAGFFSNCTVALWHLCELHRRLGRLPARLDCSHAFSSYRSTAGQMHGRDVHPVFFAPLVTPPPAMARALPAIQHHGIQRWTRFERYQPLVRHYFDPGPAARALQQDLIARHRIVLDKTIAVVYRGTDKHVEVALASPRAYLAVARQLLRQHPGHRVWIQTDEPAVRDLFLSSLGTRCFHLPEMPVSPDGAVVHDLPEETLGMTREAFGITLVAVTQLLAQADWVVNHTGNMALWICLYRGHARRVVQFDDHGSRVDLRSPAFYCRQLGGEITRAWRALKGLRRAR